MNLFSNGKKVSVTYLDLLIKIRSFKWLRAFKGLHRDLESLWGVNPVGVVLLYSKKVAESGPVRWNVKIIGFSDGACKGAQNGNVNCGIGGILIDSKKKVMFSFS